jgi:ribosomal protein L20
MGWSKEGKVRLLIKAYLTLHKRKCTSREISDWITVNNFGMNNTSVHPNMITKLVKIGINTNDRMFQDVNINKEGKVNEIWVE